MAVYVDDLFDYGKTGRLAGQWCHMWADTLTELHRMADRIGLPRRYFQNRAGFPHYDLRASKRALALQLGAQRKSLKTHLMERKTN